MEVRRGLIFFLVSFVLSILPLGVIISGGTLLVSRKYLGRAPYYLAILLVSALVIPNLSPHYWLGFVIMSLMVGVFVEAKIQHSSDLKAGLISILSSCGFLSIGTGIWIQTKKIDLLASLRQEVNLYFETLSTATEVSIDVDTLLAQFPSAIVGAMILSLWIALSAERAIINKGWAKQGFLFYGGMKPESHYGFRLPEWIIWPVLGAILFGFVDLKIPLAHEIASNLFNVFVVVYLLQGIAVISSFFKDHQVSLFWQILWYFMFLHTYFVVSLIGFADYWLDFRKKFMSHGHEANIKK